MGKKAIQFGGGNIGRGFVAEFLHESGYEVVFIDVVPQVIESLNKNKSYEVTEISEEGEKTKTITNYRALSSKTQEPEVVKEIATADVVTCAVGPNILKFIAPVIAKGIDAREEGLPPIAVIACENAINATDALRGYIEEHLDKSRLDTLPKRARFANSAIDRIVPTQPEHAGLNVRIEKFYEWAVEQTPFGEYGHPDISAIHWVDHLEPYIERKLFTVNTGHATAAYYGYKAGKKTIHEAMAEETIHKAVHAALDETASLIISKHEITEQEQKEYVKTIISRISNPYLEDVVERVGRAPLRKLSRKERFIGPAAQLAERGMKFDALLGSIEKALQFQNVKGDDESTELAKILSEKTAAEATQQITGLETDHPLYQPVLKVVEKVQSVSKYQYHTSIHPTNVVAVNPLTIPIIDISDYLSKDESATASIASSISSTAQSPGFLQITGHGIAPELTIKLLDRLKAFFALPLETKTTLHRNNSPALREFEAVGEQSLEKGVMDSKEGFMIGPEWLVENAKNARFLQGPNQWPAETDVDGLRAVMMEYFREMQALSKIMFRLIALGLTLEESYFDGFVGSEDLITMCRAHRYPPTTQEMSKKSRGIGAHTDFGALTLLLQDKEVFHRPTETWHPVQPVVGAFVVNIGDMLERWTNNKYTSTLHRVTSPVSNEYRYSVAFFNEGLLDQMIECIPTCLESGQKALYEPVKVEEHLRERYGSSYIKVGIIA